MKKNICFITALMATTMLSSSFAKAAQYNRKYDDDGNLLEETQSSSKILYTYDSVGNKTATSYSCSNGNCQTNPSSVYTYNQQGDILSNISYVSNNGQYTTQIQSIYTYSYNDKDNDGKIDEKITYRCSDSSCFEKTNASRETYTYTIDETTGNITRGTVRYSWSGFGWQTMTGGVGVPTTDADGNLVKICSTYGCSYYDDHGQVIASSSRGEYYIYNNQYDEKGQLISIKGRACYESSVQNCIDSINVIDWNDVSISSSYRNTYYTKNADGSTTIKDASGNLLGFEGKRIYTIDEANEVAGAKNRVSITYR